MNARERDEFLRQPHTAVLATVDAKGRAHAVPVWYLWNGESFEMIGGKDSAKMRHVALRGHTPYRGREAAEKIVARGGHESQRFLTLRPERWYAWPDALDQ